MSTNVSGAAAVITPSGDIATLREPACGPVLGCAGAHGGHVWLGIPYASPPLGANRWRAPRPAAIRDFLLHATTARGPACQDVPAYQRRPAAETHVGSEDCLYLNIWSPSLSPAQLTERNPNLPVMVWIHGGANVHGRGDTFDGSVLATTQDVIVVSFNYRLGVFGWFRHAALRAEVESPLDRSGNYALLDMLAALRWVRDNIAAFGGDPANVTVFGESAGGTNVFALLISPLAVGLFQRAIIQSGIIATMATAQAENHVDDDVAGNAQSSAELLLRLLIDDGFAPDRDAARQHVSAMDAASIAAYLRGKSFVELDTAYTRIADRASLQTFPQLFRDGAVLSADAMTTELRNAAIHPCVPVMIGSTRDEFSLLLPFISGSMFVAPGPAGAAIIADKRRYALVAEYLSLLLKAHAVDLPAEIFSIERRQPVFVYRFDWAELAPVFWLDDIAAGATHGLDVPFVFGHAQLGPEFFQLRLLDAHSDSFRTLSRQMMSYWAEFARGGDPDRGRDGSLPPWQSWRAPSGSRATMHFDAPGHGGLDTGSDSLTTAKVLAMLQGDDRIPSAAEKYQLLSDLQRTGGSFGLFGEEDITPLLAQLQTASKAD
jgi:para-nitrobenzyl esterase